MGLYDTVHVPCPNCGTLSEFQSKSGDCTLSNYQLSNAPADVLVDINRHAPNTCDKCGTKYFVKTEITTKAWSAVWCDEDDEDTNATNFW